MSVIERCSDHWIVSSLLQKAIRRGDEEIASRAASRLLDLRGSTLWRRFVVIAFEDVGIGAPSALSEVCQAFDPAWRRSQAPDEAVADKLARTLARSTKSRTAEQVWTTACHSPVFAGMREIASRKERETQRATLQGLELPLIERAVQIIVQPAMALRTVAEWLPPLLERHASSEAALMLKTVGAAARITREPFVLLVPLIWMHVRETAPEVITEALPQVRYLADFPLYALDKHTRLGRTAIRRFASDNGEVRAALDSLPKESRLKAAYMAAFYADAAPLDRRVAMAETEQFERSAREADLLRSGVPPSEQQPLQSAFETNLDQLNDHRAEVYAQVHGSLAEEGRRA